LDTSQLLNVVYLFHDSYSFCAKVVIFFGYTKILRTFALNMSETLKEKTAKGLFWGAVNNGSAQVLNLVIGIVLARLLSPAEYGIVGVLTIFTAVAGALQASGFTQGLINLKAPTSKDYNSVFWFNITASLILYAILFFSAPLIAAFFHQPCLVEVSRLVFLTLPISALGIACYAYMLKNMMNREMAIVGIIALISSGASGILLAYLGYSYWSLAWQQIVYITVSNIARFYYTPWRPSFAIDFGPVKKMFSFCVRLLITNIINILNQNILTFVFGRLFAISSVGNYSQANKWNTMANSTITGSIGQIAQTVLVSISDEQDREVRVFRKLLRFTAFLSFPIMLGLALVAHEFIVTTLGEKWTTSASLLQILCLGGAFMPFYSLYQNLVISKGRSDWYMWCNIGQVLLQLALIFLLHTQGITAIVWACTLFSILWLGVWQIIVSKLTDIHLTDVLKDTLPFFAVSLVVMTVTYLMTDILDANLIVLLLLRIFIAAVLYVSVMRLFRVKILDECFHFFLKKSRK